MQKKTKIVKATGRVAAAKSTAKPTFWARVCSCIKACAKFIFITVPVAIWNWLRRQSWVTLINLALLLVVIILVSMMICRTVGNSCSKVRTNTISAAVGVSKTADAPAPTVVDVPARVTIDPTKDQLTISVPLTQIGKPVAEAMAAKQNVATRPAPTPVREKRPLVANVERHGDTIVDGTRGADSRPVAGANIRGNLYLQNMRQYTLPCNVRVEGDLYLRNVNMMRFCGPFTVTGNIYVSANSSFGPIPANGRLGGQVIF
ncbi:MAG: hypothetical protein FWF34_02880 [Alphaproteobacteria bacterium]|nr:hypothetical protein [Alphaproteobacteria bacterium]MCL2890175.1 hypothetical protein [Alphaproteobacteria bacterium]